MTTLTQTQPQLLEKETVFIEGIAVDVDLTLTDWQTYYSGRATVTILAELYSVAEDQNNDGQSIPCWSGQVACTVAEPTEAAVKELIRSYETLSVEHYHIGRVWKPGLLDAI